MASHVMISIILHLQICIYTSRFACLRCASCERYAFAENRLSGVSKNYASPLADLSRPSGFSSTYIYLQFIGLKLKVQIVLIKIIPVGWLISYILLVNGIQNYVIQSDVHYSTN